VVVNTAQLNVKIAHTCSTYQFPQRGSEKNKTKQNKTKTKKTHTPVPPSNFLSVALTCTLHSTNFTTPQWARARKRARGLTCQSPCALVEP